jgi:hypothetical protein
LRFSDPHFSNPSVEIKSKKQNSLKDKKYACETRRGAYDFAVGRPE